MTREILDDSHFDFQARWLEHERLLFRGTRPWLLRRSAICRACGHVTRQRDRCECGAVADARRRVVLNITKVSEGKPTFAL
jgi:hypothetical protein